MILVNGVVSDHVAATDRGLAYGDGVFRTLLWRQGRLDCWRRHYRKLAHDCAALAIPCAPESTLFEEACRVAGPAETAAIKITVTRGVGARGYGPPAALSPTRIVLSAPLPAYPEAYAREGVRVHWCRIRLARQPRLAGVKHLNRLENVLARSEWSDPAIAEGLVLDEGGEVVGGTMTNVFLVEDDRLVTPALTHCGVAGVTRERIRDAARTRGVECREEPVSPDRLLRAREVLLVNSLIGVWRVRECAGGEWPTQQYAARVRKWLGEDGD